MIPVYLKLEGIYSYQTRQEIDFRKLTGAAIFGIFGPVGSGKSAILEAMMFALYGEVARLKKSEDRNYNIMNLNSSTLYIEFEFEAGAERYKSEVIGKRNKKRFDKIESLSTTYYIYDRDKGDWVPKADFDAATIIGLTIDDFRKTIILPQNSFQDFLQLKDGERTDMMKRLFRLERYDLSDKVAILDSRNKGEIDRVHGGLAQIGEVKGSDLEEQEAEIIVLGHEIEKLDLKLKETRIAESTAQTLQLRFKEFGVLSAQLTELVGKGQEMEGLEKRLDDYNKCFRLFHSLLQQWKGVEARIVKNDIEIREKRGVLDEQLKSYEALQNSLLKLKVEYETRDHLKKQEEAIGVYVQLMGLEEEITKLSVRVKKGEALISATGERMRVLQSERGQLGLEKEKLATYAPDFNELKVVQDWFNTYTRYVHELDRLKAEEKKRAATAEAIERDKRIIFRDSLPLIGLTLAPTVSIPEAIRQLKETRLRLIHQQDWIREQVIHLSASKEFERLVSGLVEGHPCPICGATHHPHKLDSADVSFQLTTVEKQHKDIVKKLETIDNISNQLETNNSNYLLREEERVRNSQFIKDSEKELEGHLKRFIWLGYSPSDPTSVDEAYKRANTWRTQSTALDAQQLDNQKQIEQEQAAETQCRNLLHGIKEELSQKKGKVETLQSTLQAGVLDGYRGWSMKDLGVESNRLKLLYVAIEKEYLGTQEKAGLILSTMDGLKGHLGSLESLLLSQREEANGLEKAQMYHLFPNPILLFLGFQYTLSR